MVAFDKLPTYAHSIKLSFKNSTHQLSLQTCLIASLDTNSLPNLSFACNTTHFNLMNQAKSSVSSSHHLANTNTNAFLWDSNVPLTLFSKSWRRYYTMLKTPVSILNIGVFFTWEHHILLISWKPTVSLSIHSNVNGPFRKLIGSAIDSHPLV
ncbi:hypothetical protein ACHAXS_000465 [Conticribra weissflogii]